MRGRLGEIKESRLVVQAQPGGINVPKFNSKITFGLERSVDNIQPVTSSLPIEENFDALLLSHKATLEQSGPGTRVATRQFRGREQFFGIRNARRPARSTIVNRLDH